MAPKYFQNFILYFIIGHLDNNAKLIYKQWFNIEFIQSFEVLRFLYGLETLHCIKPKHIFLTLNRRFIMLLVS